MSQLSGGGKKGERWEVVGGGAKGGLLVRDGADTASALLHQRLATGSVVEELELIGDRLWYKLVSGTGPESGWVSTALKGKPLLEKLSDRKMKLSQLVLLLDKDLPTVPIRWRSALDKGLPALVREVDLTMAEALVAEDSAARTTSRMPKLIQEFFVFLNELVKGDASVQAGGALVNCLFHLSMSLTLHQVVAKRAPAAVAPCALILGHGGSAVQDLQHQIDYYQSLGFSTVASTPVGCPVALNIKQKQQIASELSLALAGGRRLVLHLCSHNGVANGMSILGSWIAKQWQFDSLPPPQHILSAIVFECAPVFPTEWVTKEHKADCVQKEPKLGQHPQKIGAAKEATTASGRAPVSKFDVYIGQQSKEEDPASGEIIVPQTDGKAESETKAESEDVAAVLNSEIDLFTKVLIGTIGGLTGHWSTKFDKGANPSLLHMARQSPKVNEFIRDAAAANVLPGKEEYHETAFDHQPVAFSMWDFEKWEMTLAKPLPRLFLYGEADFVVTQDKVEAYARHVSRYNPKAKVVLGKIPKAAHCMCWVQDKAKSASLVQEILSFSDLSVPPIASSDMGA